MRYPVEETAQKHQKLLNASAALFRTNGLDGVSVGEVMKAAGMTHGAFYSHFESKDQLAAAAMACAMDQVDESMAKDIESSAEPKRTFLENYLSIYHRDNPKDGCPMATLGVEIGRRKIGRAELTRHFQRLIRRAVDGFSWKRREPKRDQAILMTAATVGALILARAVDDPALSKEILEATRKQLLDR